MRERYRWTSLRNKIGLWGLVTAILIGAIGFQWLQPAYQTTKMWFFINMAEKAVARKDYQSASLAYRRALHAGQDKAVTWLSLAKFLDQINSPELINVWARLAKLEPGVAQYRFNQAAAALRFQRVFQAEEVIGSLPPDWRAAAGAVRIEAEIDIRKKQFASAEKLLVRLLELEPTDAKANFDLLCLRAASEDEGIRGEARRKIEQIAASESAFTVPALRRLVDFAAEAGDMNEADRLAAKLADRPGATIQDRLTYAQAEAAANSFTLAITLQNLRAHAAGNLADFGPVLQWFINTHLDAPGTARWVANLPAKTLAQPEVESALFPYYLAVADWDHVFELLRKPTSPLHLPPKVLELAEAALEQDRANETSADRTWQEAVYAAEGQPKTLQILSLLASARGWSSATGRALSSLADAAPGEMSVWWLLVQHENSARNLPGLYKALGGLMRLNPYDINVASNWVLAGSLIRHGDIKELLEVAERTYFSTYPSDAQAATAYAVALLERIDRRKR